MKMEKVLENLHLEIDRLTKAGIDKSWKMTLNEVKNIEHMATVPGDYAVAVNRSQMRTHALIRLRALQRDLTYSITQIEKQQNQEDLDIEYDGFVEIGKNI